MPVTGKRNPGKGEYYSTGLRVNADLTSIVMVLPSGRRTKNHSGAYPDESPEKFFQVISF